MPQSAAIQEKLKRFEQYNSKLAKDNDLGQQINYLAYQLNDNNNSNNNNQDQYQYERRNSEKEAKLARGLIEENRVFKYLFCYC
jgi:hypothetical protein